VLYTVELTSELLHGNRRPLAHITFADGKKGTYLTLDGFSMESFDAGLAQLRRCLNPITSWRELTKQVTFFPSVNFFIETLSAKEPPLPIKTALLYYGIPLDSICSDYRTGHRTFKLKLRRFDETTVHALDTLVGLLPAIRLRLDFNGSIKELPPDLKRWLAHPCLDYIEEPGFHPSDYNCPIDRFAVDESLRKHGLIPYQDYSTFIIKPLLQVDDDRTIERLCSCNKRVIISSAFESQEGITALKTIIVRHQLTHDTHGLDTLKYHGMPPASVSA